MLLFSIVGLFYAFLNPLLVKLLTKAKIVTNHNTMLVHFVSVGQGDAIAVNLPDGKVMLIDCGTEEKNVTLTQYLEENVFNTSRKKFIDYLILTHADIDHTGGALRVLQNYGVGTIFMPPEIEDAEYTNYFLNLKNFIKSAKIEEKINENGIKIAQKGYQIEFFGPLEAYNSTNENCPVIKLTFKNFSFLFTGDITDNIETDLVNNFGLALDCDVLKVAHHGSKNSSSAQFLSAASPKYAVVCCDYNSYGHPTNQAVARLKAAGAEILRTDLNGNIVFAVGQNYNLAVLTGKYYVTNVIFDYRYIFLLVDAILAIKVVVIIFKKTKNTKKTHKKS